MIQINKTVFKTLAEAMKNKNIIETLTNEKWNCFLRHNLDNKHFWVLTKKSDPPPPNENQLTIF